MILNTKRSGTPYLLQLPPPPSQSSLRFSLQLAIYELQAILRQVHQQNDIEH